MKCDLFPSSRPPCVWPMSPPSYCIPWRLVWQIFLCCALERTNLCVPPFPRCYVFLGPPSPANCASERKWTCQSPSSELSSLISRVGIVGMSPLFFISQSSRGGLFESRMMSKVDVTPHTFTLQSPSDCFLVPSHLLPLALSLSSSSDAPQE